MAHRGQKVVFHGAYDTKAAAKRKERATPGAFIRPAKIKGHRRELVLTRKRG